jgi:hypothetical protein
MSKMESGEIFAWLLFLIVITLLFFAAFGQSSFDEQTIEEYMENLSKDNDEGQR